MDNNEATCANCGHGEGAHYNATEAPNYTHGARDERRARPRNRPCHRRGRHDMRCGCRNFRSAS